MPRIVSLDEFRRARRAAEFLRGTYHEPPWLRGVGVEVASDGKMVIVVELHWTTVMIGRCIPTAVDYVPVVQRVVGGGQASPTGGFPP